MEPRLKKRKGVDVLRLGRGRSFATQSAISELCRAVEKDGIPECYSRKAQSRSLKNFTQTSRRHMGPGWRRLLWAALRWLCSALAR